MLVIAAFAPSERAATGPESALRARPGFLTRAQQRFALLHEIWNLPRVMVTLGGDREGTAFYRWFTSLHPRFPLICYKTWGIALQPVPESLKEYLKGKERQALRTNMGHSKRAGFTAHSETRAPTKPGGAFTQIMFDALTATPTACGISSAAAASRRAMSLALGARRLKADRNT